MHRHEIPLTRSTKRPWRHPITGLKIAHEMAVVSHSRVVSNLFDTQVGCCGHGRSSAPVMRHRYARRTSTQASSLPMKSFVRSAASRKTLLAHYDQPSSPHRVRSGKQPSEARYARLAWTVNLKVTGFFALPQEHPLSTTAFSSPVIFPRSG
jgi:hypothetical protein